MWQVAGIAAAVLAGWLGKALYSWLKKPKAK
jgi:hypothetical protein